ncbi:MAG: hypothetical protein IJT18_00455 [Oscillospiraceae bacterium]|nr:hypothetical protein [Oscillospiraceae bacterium]
MKRVYRREAAILPSMCDSAGRLSVPGTFALFMDAATEHAEALGVGLRAMAAKNLFWLTVRTRVRFFRRPAMMETVTVETFPEDAGRVRCDRDYRLLCGEELLAAGKTEWAILDTATGKLRPAQDVMPAGIEPPVTPVWEEPFSRIDEDFSGAEALGAYTVASTDIDLGGHMNNAAYIRALAGMFPGKVWNAMRIRELEAVFRAPCFEGDTIAAVRRTADGATDIRMRVGEKTVLLARLVSE